MKETSCDVLVIGAGLAGFATALSAAESGAQVLLVEKQNEVGGSTVLSGGSFAFAGTDLQAAQGIEDSPERLFDDLMDVGGRVNDPALAKMYVQENLSAYQWLLDHGTTFGKIQAASGQSVPRSHPADPRDVIEKLAAAASEVPNISLSTESEVQRLVLDAATARVTGAIVRQDRADLQIQATRGVVITSGGFCQNKEMIEAFSPGAAGAIRLGASGNVGDGVRMAWKLGAGLRDMPYVKGTFGNHPSAKQHEHTACMAVYKGAIAVNIDGRRFMNESLDYKLLGDQCLLQKDALAYQIFDHPILDEEIPGYPMFEFRPRLDEGRLLTAPTLAELAEKIGVPAGNLQASVDAYNETVTSGGGDPFGRTHLTHTFGDLVPISTGPFYAYPSTSAIVATYAGITVDAHAQVTDVFGEPIPGLFAAGEVIGGFHGAAYMTGTSLGKATIFGRIAGRAAAKV